MDFLTLAASTARRPALFALLALATALVAATPREAPAQQAFSLAEIRQIQNLRDLRHGGEPGALADASVGYLRKFPQGRYADEALLSLGEARSRLEKPKGALRAYTRLIKDHPRSPFREQAMAASVSLLMGSGKPARAHAMAKKMLQRYPRSIYRNGVLLWQAREKFQAGAYAESLVPIEQIRSGELTAEEQGGFYRMAGWAYHKSGQPQKAGPMFAKYLKREDSAERKAPVLMLMGQAAEDNGKPAEALAHYSELVERYPHPANLPEALFRRAEVFRRTVLERAGTDAREAAEQEDIALAAIGFYSAYLRSADLSHEDAALRQRAPLLNAAGRKEEALRDYQRLAELSRSQRIDRELLVNIVGLLGEAGRGAEGVALLTRAIENSAVPQQERAILTVERAALYYRGGNCRQVVRGLEPLPVFREARHRNQAVFLRGFCRYRLGQWERASWDLERVVGEPEFVEVVWAALMDSYEKSGQVSRLANLGERLLQSGQIEPGEALLRSMAAAYEKLGQPERMLSTIRRLQALNADAVLNPEMQYRLGRAEEAVGNLDQARIHYLAALEGIKSKDGARANDRANDGANDRANEGDKPNRINPKDGLDPAALRALEHLQSLYLNGNQYEQLAALNESAAKSAAGARISAQQKRIATLQAITYLRWGQALAESGEAEQARGKFEAAWARIPAGFTDQRMEILRTVADSHAGKNQYEAARKIYAKELKRAKGKDEKAAISAALGGLYLGWAESTDKKDPPAKVSARYEKALALLPPERWRERYRAALRLDGIYQKGDKFKARAQLFGGLEPTLPASELKEQVRTYRARIYRDWARFHLTKGNHKTAAKLLSQGEALLKKEQWRVRYELLALRGELLIKQKNYSNLLIRYEKFLPSIQDPALKDQVNQFVGQIYLTWAQSAKKAGNLKSTRIRSRRALEYLPESDWQRRLSAATLLNGALDKLKRFAESAEVFEALIPTIPDMEVRRRYALFLGRKYLRQIKQPDAAEPWLIKGDLGGNDPLSLEAGYLAAEMHLEKKERNEAKEKLEALTGRGLSESNWRVPIHSRLALLYHEDKEMEKALENYRVVAAVKSKALRRLYPRSIDIAKEQVRAIRGYLRFKGGSGPKVAVPRVAR